MALPACSTVPSAPPSIIEVEATKREVPAEAGAACTRPDVWSDYVHGNTFAELDAEAQVNTVLQYAAYVIAVFGECNVRHEALREYNGVK